MNPFQNRQLRSFSQQLRRNMTKEERRLWYDFLKGLPVTVRRQKVLGSYIADFYIAAGKIVIELDGSQHYTDSGAENDQARDAWMRKNGITVLRYTNLQIQKEFRAVCQDIADHLQDAAPTA
ncbi:MAG: endonuclease domain-containing protein [Clostridia bacterium]|nr:endonuclease domain-containing protein [Clostridia bacterium]